MNYTEYTPQAATKRYRVLATTELSTGTFTSSLNFGDFNSSVEASNHARELTGKFPTHSFSVKDTQPPTDKEIMAEFSHWDFA